jgi:hypothetical protein
MAESIYDVFQSIASLGMQVTLYLKTDGKLIEKRGSIRNITSTGVLIQNSSEISFISSQSIETFTVTREGDNNQQLNSRGDDEKSPTDNYQDRLPADADPKLDNNIFGIFFEQFELPSPQPDFNVSGLTTDDRTDVVRWKNRYDYAIKINEKVRLLDDIRSIGRLAERLRHAELYFLAGALAILGGKHELAQPQLMNGLALGSMRAGTALTWLAWQDNDFSKAAEMACRAVTLDPNAFGGNEASIIILGRILAKLPDPAIPWLLDALAQFAGSPSETTTNPLIGFALRMLSPAAAEAALAGDLDGAKRLFPEAKLLRLLTHQRSTSSAMARSPGGTSMPSALAVCMLMTSSNLIDCATKPRNEFPPSHAHPIALHLVSAEPIAVRVALEPSFNCGVDYAGGVGRARGQVGRLASTFTPRISGSYPLRPWRVRIRSLMPALSAWDRAGSPQRASRR